MYLSHTELLPHLRFATVGAGHVPPAHSTFKSIGNLSYQVAPHCVLPQPSKAFVIRSFFSEKWLLTHAFGGPKGLNFSCRQACVEVPAFFPLVLCKQRLDLLKYLAVCLDLILISDHAYRASLKDRLRDRCKGADVFHSRV